MIQQIFPIIHLSNTPSLDGLYRFAALTDKSRRCSISLIPAKHFVAEYWSPARWNSRSGSSSTQNMSVPIWRALVFASSYQFVK